MILESYCCISYYSYIKPQPCKVEKQKHYVVYRTIPTSNHNFLLQLSILRRLYIVLFLHQTTTSDPLFRNEFQLYIVLFLHQTTTMQMCVNMCRELYIVLFLHQTTTDEVHGQLNGWLYIVLFLHQTTTASSCLR